MVTKMVYSIQDVVWCNWVLYKNKNESLDKYLKDLIIIMSSVYMALATAFWACRDNFMAITCTPNT